MIYMYTTTHVFLRVDKVKEPLQTPYDGPYRVLKRSKKWFRIQIGDKEDTGVLKDSNLHSF